MFATPHGAGTINAPSQLRDRLAQVLRIPLHRASPPAECRGSFEHDGLVVERWVWQSEPASWVTGTLYRPRNLIEPAPAILVTNGNGESKSTLAQRYAGQLYAKLGLICLVYDTIGEEERNARGELGTREHNRQHVIEAVAAADRPMMGKMVLDALRGFDLLCARLDVDRHRLGVVGNSMGGATASWVLALETRVRMGVVCGWAFDDKLQITGKSNTREADERLRQQCTWGKFLSLWLPHGSTLILNGDADTIIDSDSDGGVWRSTHEAAESAMTIAYADNSTSRIETHWVPGGGHRPYYLSPQAVKWIRQWLGTPRWTNNSIRNLPTVTLENWCRQHNIDWYGGYRDLYWTDLHVRQTMCVDLNIQPFELEKLRCISSKERCSPHYSMDGWIELIRRRAV